jgi:hypothetical protein
MLCGFELYVFELLIFDLYVIIVEVVKMVLEQEAVTLAINGHSLANDLMNVSIGSVFLPQAKRGDDIDALNDI